MMTPALFNHDVVVAISNGFAKGKGREEDWKDWKTPFIHSDHHHGYSSRLLRLEVVLPPTNRQQPTVGRVSSFAIRAEAGTNGLILFLFYMPCGTRLGRNS